MTMMSASVRHLRSRAGVLQFHQSRPLGRHLTAGPHLRRVHVPVTGTATASTRRLLPRLFSTTGISSGSSADGGPSVDGGDADTPEVESDDNNDDSIEEEDPEPLPPLSPPLEPSKHAAPPLKDHLKNQKSPHEVVAELDQHIVGQAEAKRAVAIALRNRWRRQQLPAELQKEVTPRNVLMIGPTGCGKTEVARRMADLGGAPFLKIEATKFTEVGYHGKDVDQIIRDLVEVSLKLTKKQKKDALKAKLEPIVEERLLDVLTGIKARPKTNNTKKEAAEGESKARSSFRDMLREGDLDEMYVEIDVPVEKSAAPEAPAMMSGQAVVAMFSNMGGAGGATQTERKKVKIGEARDILLNVECEKMLESMDLKKEAIKAVEESGIVYLDEIDKICTSRNGGRSSSDASDEGVQRDLLPLVEGTTISTKHGNVNTDYILFIASGAFHSVKPSDMLPELQGRLPIRVNLAGLTENDLYRILTEPVANLIRQQTELLATEGVLLEFTYDAKKEIAHMAAQVNRSVENIGARRLHTVMERIMEEISFDAGNNVVGDDEDDASEDATNMKTVTVTKELVQERLGDLVASESELQKYIL